MSDSNRLNRRNFLALSGSAVITGLAGCSDNGGTPAETPSDTETSSDSTDTTTDESSGGGDNTTTDDELAPETERDEPEEPSGKVIDSLSDYRYVANNPDEWIGKEIEASDVSYYQRYEEDYQGFRMVFNEENTARPFMLKTDQEFQENETISFSGTVEAIDEIQNVKVILVENVTIE